MSRIFRALRVYCAQRGKMPQNNAQPPLFKPNPTILVSYLCTILTVTSISLLVTGPTRGFDSRRKFAANFQNVRRRKEDNPTPGPIFGQKRILRHIFGAVLKFVAKNARRNKSQSG